MILLILLAASLDNSAVATTVAATTAVGGTYNVTFRSHQGTFTSVLQDPTSAAFQARASMIQTQLEPLFQASVTPNMTLTVVSFRNDSIINDLKLRFFTAVPDYTEIASVMVEASSRVTGFDIQTASISVNNIVSGGASHKISLLSSLCLLLLSWLLSSNQ